MRRISFMARAPGAHMGSWQAQVLRGAEEIKALQPLLQLQTL